jgi:hypothetical protein
MADLITSEMLYTALINANEHGGRKPARISAKRGYDSVTISGTINLKRVALLLSKDAEGRGASQT